MILQTKSVDVKRTPDLALFQRLSPEGIRTAIQCELAKRSLAEFIRQAWHVHHPATPLVWSWHIDAVAEHLEAVSRGEIERLVINVPPGFMKSLEVSVYWPCWEWVTKPHLQYIVVSAAGDLALRDARRMRETIKSTWYQQTFLPQFNFAKTQDAKGYFINTNGGFRLSRSTGQKITGFRGDRIIMDDPIDANEAYSDKKALKDHILYYDQTLSSRKNKPNSPQVLIMQRLHERDLSGHLLERGGWHHLCLPNEHDPSRRATTWPGWTNPRKEPGELLCEYLVDATETLRIKKDLGERGYAGQYQQLPAPAQGAIFKEETFRFWTHESLPRMDRLISSWDCAGFKVTTDSDFVVGQVWGVRQAERYLIGQIRRKMGLPAVLLAIKETLRKYPGMRAVIVEAKATGPEVVQRLQKEVPGVVTYNPQGESKQGRAHAVQPLYEAGQIFIPHPQWNSWVRDEYIPELLAFPDSRRDDQVDATTQALLWLEKHMGFWVARLDGKKKAA